MKPEILEELVTLTVVEPSPDLDERIRFKYPNIACELLTCDLAAINERIASDEALLAKLYAFVDCEPPLHPLLASFFSKIMGVLIAKQTVQVGPTFISDSITSHDYLQKQNSKKESLKQQR